MDAIQRKQMAARKFTEIYGTRPQLWARAPGRVDLMGSHTDYNLGYVMTMTIDRDTWLAASPRLDHKVRLHSLNAEGWGELDLRHIEHDPAYRWTDYVRGVAWALQQAGYRLQGFDGLIHSTVPFSSGLSSSAALEMAAAVMFQLSSGFRLDSVEMALLGQKAENEFVGMNCGILDQYSSAMGQTGSAILLDCRALTSQVTPIAPGIQVVICDTRAERNLVGSEYGERRSQCEQGVRLLKNHYPEIQALRDVSLAQLDRHSAELPPVVYRRCRFVIEENQRVLDLAHALPGGEAKPLADLFEASYRGAVGLYEIGAPSMQAMREAMLNGPGVIAARQAGAGFGGCMVALVKESQTKSFIVAVEQEYRRRTGIQPAIYTVQAAPGAGPL